MMLACMYGLVPPPLPTRTPIIEPLRPVARESRETLRARNPRRNAAEVEKWIIGAIRRCKGPATVAQLAPKLKTTVNYASQTLAELAKRGRVQRARQGLEYVYWEAR